MIVVAVASAFISIFLLSILAWREQVHDQERQDLLNRIMAKDYGDYTRINSGRPPPAGNILKKAVMEHHPGYSAAMEEGEKW